MKGALVYCERSPFGKNAGWLAGLLLQVLVSYGTEKAPDLRVLLLKYIGLERCLCLSNNTLLWCLEFCACEIVWELFTWICVIGRIITILVKFLLHMLMVLGVKWILFGKLTFWKGPITKTPLWWVFNTVFLCGMLPTFMITSNFFSLQCLKFRKPQMLIQVADEYNFWVCNSQQNCL